MVYESADKEADIIFGVVIDEKMSDEMRVTIIATGFAESPEGIPAASESVRKRPNIFAQTGPLTIEDESARGHDFGEPNQIPAIERKRGTVSTPAAPPIDFDSEQNPLREWDRSGNGGSGAAQASTAGNGGSGMAAQPAPVAAASTAPVFNEAPAQSVRPQAHSEPPATEEDPYDIPALQRRRRQRFFE